MIARRPSVLAAYILAALLASTLSHPAGAAATFQVLVLTSALAQDGGSDSDYPPESDTGMVPIGSLPFELSNSQSAAASFGTASASGLATGKALLTLPGTFGGAILDAVATMAGTAPAGVTSAGGFGRVQVAYLDVLTAGGLPLGSPVTLRVTLELDGAMELTGAGSTNTMRLWFGDPGTPTEPIDTLVCTNLTGHCGESDTGEIIVFAGAPSPIRLDLYTDVFGSAFSNGNPFVSASSDFNMSLYPAARLHIDVLTPGASYTLDSGGDLRSSPDGAGRVPDGSTGVPLLLDKASGMITLSWGVSCQAADTDYAVYEGMLGNFTSHDSRFCTTGGATTMTFTPIAGDAYYLVVPLNTTHEGSYGKNGLGAERPQSLNACLPQSIAACP